MDRLRTPRRESRRLKSPDIFAPSEKRMPVPVNGFRMEGISGRTGIARILKSRHLRQTGVSCNMLSADLTGSGSAQAIRVIPK